MAANRVVAPTRADLAGGTLDIWPLSLLVPNACTVNAALGLEVWAEVAPAPRWEVVMVDRGVELTPDGPADPRLAAEAPLIAAALAALPPPEPVLVATCSPVPAGSGLGASSALCVALLRALGGPADPAALTRLARDVEGRLLGMPPGFQDAGAAAFGGVGVFHHELGGWRHERLAVEEWLAPRLLLFYSGESRFSGTNNLRVFAAAVNQDAEVLGLLGRIAAAAAAAADALRAQDAPSLGLAVGEEMAARGELAPGILTPALEGQFAAAARAGALAAKVCGAGGGGCALALVEPARAEEVAAALVGAGAEMLAPGLQPLGARRE